MMASWAVIEGLSQPIRLNERAAKISLWLDGIGICFLFLNHLHDIANAPNENRLYFLGGQGTKALTRRL